MNEQLRNALPHKDTPFFRMLHIIVATLILLQIISSNLTESEALRDVTLTGVVTWFHVISVFALMVLGVVMLVWMLKQRGFRYYFAWSSLDFRGVVEDIKMLMTFRLPEAHAGGIAAMIQGLAYLLCWRSHSVEGSGLYWTPRQGRQRRWQKRSCICINF